MKALGLFLALFVFIIIVTNIASLVDEQDGIPDVFRMVFPEEFVDEEAMIARETLEAPFKASEDAANVDETYDPLIGSINVSESLDMPHRHEAAVSEWLMTTLPETMTFGLAGYQQQLAELGIYMTPNGLKEFQEFLELTKILQLMQSGNYDMRGFVSDVPQLKTSGVVEGVYKWVYDVPLSLTFLPLGMTSYEGLEPDAYQFEELVVRMQLTRVPVIKRPPGDPAFNQPGAGREGLAIETWEVLGRRPE